MSVIRLKQLVNLRLPFCVRKSSTDITRNEEYTSTPMYPKIMDISREAVKQREKEAWHEEIKALETVEEKIFKINMPRYYGFKTISLREHCIPLQSLEFIQHCTRTHFIKNNSLPEFYVLYDSAASYMAKQLRADIEDAIKFEYHSLKRKFELTKQFSDARQEDDLLAKSVIFQINRLLTNHLASSIPHLMESQVDNEPRHESFWYVGGFSEYPKNIRIKGGRHWNKYYYRPRDFPVRYLGSPVLSVRSEFPLEPIVPYSDADNQSLEVPLYDLYPSNRGFFFEHCHGTNIPGFWPGDTQEFGLLSYHSRGYMKDRTRREDDNLEALDSQGIMTSFGWLMAQACYQGFSTYNEITYPLTTQTIITNGRLWSFYAYQMNTLLVHGDNFKTNKLRNICYGTEPLKLFESVDSEGKVIGFNDDVLKMLIQFYINVPKERKDTLMKPYLGEKVKVIADIEHEEKRVWLEKYYKHLVANRPRHKLMYEIYDWEKIYKIRFKTRSMEPKRRPFELHQNPMAKRLDDHHPAYIPKVYRSHPKSRKKWEKTYYP